MQEKKLNNGDVVGWCIVLDGEAMIGDAIKGRKEAREKLAVARNAGDTREDKQRFKLAKIVLSH